MRDGQQRVRYGTATVSWGPRPWGPDRVIANGVVESFDDLIEAVRIARDMRDAGQVRS